MSAWISVKDRLPKHGSTVLAYFPETDMQDEAISIAMHRTDSAFNWYHDLNEPDAEPTH